MDHSASPHHASRSVAHPAGWSGVPLMSLAAGLALAVWTAAGAYRWRGYPSEAPGGWLIALALDLSLQLVLYALLRLCLAEAAPGRAVVWGALACWSAARLVAASLYPLGSDEAYHWQWAERLDLCYYDHPAMVAWLARLLAPWGGESTALVRLSCVAMGAAMPLMAAVLARQTVGDEALGRRVAFLVMLTPLYACGPFLIPSIAVGFFWLASLLLFWRALRSDKLVDWVLPGLCFGGALNCNFTTLLLPAAALLFLLLSKTDRSLLMRRGPYVALAVSAACFLPVLVWNARHDWCTFIFNFARRHEGLSFRPSTVASYFGQIMLYLSPVLAAAAIGIGAISGWRAWRRQERAVLFLAVLGFLPIVVFLITSGLLKARAHYAAPGFIPLLILLAAWMWAPGQSPPAQARRARLARRGLRLAHAICACFFAAVLYPVMAPAWFTAAVLEKLSPKEASKRTAELHGWPALGAFLDAQGGPFTIDSPTVVMAPSYAQASLAMFYSHRAEYVYSRGEGKMAYGQQFRIWGAVSNLPAGRDAILFWAGRLDENALAAEMEKFSPRFEKLERVETDRPGHEPNLKYFTILRGEGYRPAEADGGSGVFLGSLWQKGSHTAEAAGFESGSRVPVCVGRTGR